MNRKAPESAPAIARSRRKLLKNATALAVSAAIAAVFTEGCKPKTADQNDDLAELAHKLDIPLQLLKQHRGFMVLWLLLTTNPNWLLSSVCNFPDSGQLEADLNGDLKKEQIDAVFAQIKGSQIMRDSLFNVGVVFNDKDVKKASGFANPAGHYGDRTCPPGTGIILSLYQSKSTFTTLDPVCVNEKKPSEIKFLKIE